jgi:aminopeptidase N
VTRASTVMPTAVGVERPSYVLPNGGGLGYGLFVLDARSRDYLLAHIEDIPDALTRGSAWVTLWDNVMEGTVPADRFFEAALRAVSREGDEQNTELILANLSRAFWRFFPPVTRQARSRELEALLIAGIGRAPTMSLKAAWFNTLRDVATTTDALAWLERVWRREERIEGLPLAEPDEIALAQELAVRGLPAAADILKVQYERTQNPDRKARFAFVMPALSSDPAVRRASFERFRQLENRRRERWVAEALRYLNHPLREADAVQYVQPSLELLAEVQRTGDIFFPARWTDAALSGHRSREAAGIVRRFLTANPMYPERLRWTILSAADPLFRAAR